MQKKIQSLINAAYHYYRLNESIISDEQYDALYQEIQEWEVQNNIEDKLTDKICLGYFEGDSTVKVKHQFSMISIEKNNGRGIEKETVISLKLDGVALELEYRKGQLYRKITRGDGIHGSDVTKCRISGIPKKLGESINIVVRGEVMCPSFLDYGNVHRNVVAGSLGKVDFTEERDLNFVAYWTSLGLSKEADTYTQELEVLNNYGFSVIPYIVSARPLNITPNLIKHNFPTDGYVLRENDNRSAGDKTAHHYKNQWAHKFAAEAKETTIIAVQWNQSKNGYFTPVAILDPIMLDGTNVTRVTLNNLDYIKEKDICIGDKVLVHKAKDIIPEIKKVINRSENRQYIVLLSCPKCGGDLEIEGVRLACKNLECSIDLYTEYFSKTIGIKGLALKSIEKLKISDPLDLYNLNSEDFFIALGKNGTKIYEQVRESINVPLVKWLCALNIPAIKATKLNKIFTKYPNLEVLGDYSKLVEVDGMGEKTSKIVVEWYNNFLIYKPVLEAIGFTMKVEEVVLTKKEIAVTGKLPMSRKEFTNIMATKGIIVKSITKNTLLLVTGEKPGEGNLNKANKYNIKTVEYNQFIKELKND